MNHSPNHRHGDAELTTLIEAVLNGQVDDAQFAELERRLQNDAAARDTYATYMNLHCELNARFAVEGDIVGLEAELERELRGLAGEVHTRTQRTNEVNDIRSSPMSRAGAKLWFLAAGILIAAVLLMAVGISLRLQPDTNGVPREPVAELQSLTGEVWLVEANKPAVKASSGRQFAAGDAVQVGAEAAAEVVLTDGSRIMLSADSLLRFAADKSQKQIHLVRGSADVDAAPQSPDRPLVITTAQARLTVLGTRFRLYAAEDDSQLELEEGKVWFERQSDGQAVEVAAGEYAVARSETATETLKPLVALPITVEWRLRQTLLRAGERVAFSHDSTRLATIRGEHLKVWEVATGELQHELRTPLFYECLAFTASDKSIVAATNRGKAMFWPLGEDSAREVELKTDEGHFRRCSVSRDGRWLALSTSAASGHVPVWRVDDTGAISSVASLPLKGDSVAVAATATGPQVVCSAWDGTTVKWEAETGRELARRKFASKLHVVDLSADGRLLGGYGNATGLLLFDTDTGEQHALWPAGSVHVSYLRFSQDGRQLFAAMADGVVRAWSTEDGQPLMVLATGDSRVISLDVSADGRWLATTGLDGRVSIWELEKKTP